MKKLNLILQYIIYQYVVDLVYISDHTSTYKQITTLFTEQITPGTRAVVSITSLQHKGLCVYYEFI